MSNILDNPISVDIETTGLEWKDRMLIISLAKRGPDGEIKTLVLNTGYDQSPNLFGLAFGDNTNIQDREIKSMKIPEARDLFQQFIADGSVLIFHNGSFDLPYIVRSGILTRSELEDHLLFDTMVMARCTDGHESVALDNLLIDYGIQVDPAWEKTKENRANLLSVPYTEVEHYAGLDAAYTLELAEKMIPIALEYYTEEDIEEESVWLKVISMMRVDGIQVDIETVKKIRAEKKKALSELAMQLRSYRIDGPNSRKAIIRWAASIGQDKKLDITKKGNISLTETSLKKLTGDAIPVVKLILEARHIEKEISTWMGVPLEHACQAGRIHPLFTVSGAKSNRLTCEKPSAHTIPKDIEDIMFTARPGYRLVAWDLEQAELRIAGSFSKDTELAREFDRPGSDPHMATAVKIWGPGATRLQRKKAKNCRFSFQYGGGARAFMFQANKGAEPHEMMDEEEAADILRQFKKANPRIVAASKRAEQVWITRGYLKVLGWKRVYASRSDLERSYKAFNYLIQPSVAELIKVAMIGIRTEFSEITLVSQKHDSIVMEIPDDDQFETRQKRIKEIIEGCYPEYLSEMTDPPIVMKAALELDKEGLPAPE